MRVKCFGCDKILEAANASAASDAFVAHVREAHKWSYPEKALRTYATNYGEAGERISTDTERLDEIREIVIHRVTAERISDWLSFFDRDAFAGNPGWASCYCLGPNVPAPKDNPARPWREARAMTAERLRCAATFGYLAYVDGKPAGWVNASKRSDYGLFGAVEDGGPAAETMIGVSCFVIAPPYRRHGVASALLDRVIADALSRGAAFIEAYPHTRPEDGDAGHFRGSRSRYEARGFKPATTVGNHTVMRLSAAR